MQAIVTLRYGKQVDNQEVNLEADHAEPKDDLAGKEGQDGQRGDNKKEGDAEPSTVTLVVEEPPRSFVPKTPYPERLQAPKK